MVFILMYHKNCNTDKNINRIEIMNLYSVKIVYILSDNRNATLSKNLIFSNILVQKL